MGVRAVVEGREEEDYGDASLAEVSSQIQRSTQAG